MTVHIRLSGDDSHTIETGTRWERENDGHLLVYRGNDLAATYAPGGWQAVVKVERPQPEPADLQSKVEAHRAHDAASREVILRISAS